MEVAEAVRGALADMGVSVDLMFTETPDVADYMTRGTPAMIQPISGTTRLRFGLDDMPDGRVATIADGMPEWDPYAMWRGGGDDDLERQIELM